MRKADTQNGQMPDATKARAGGAANTGGSDFADALQHASDILYTHDLDGNFTWVNESVQQLTGYSRDEILRLNLADLLTPASLDLAWRMIRKQAQDGGRGTYEIAVHAKDGRTVTLEVSTRVVLRPGRPASVLGIARDVSERKTNEAHLRLLKSVVVNANDAVLIVEANAADPLGSRIVYVNDAFTRMAGYEMEEALGETTRILLGPRTDRAQLDRVRAALSACVPIRVEMVNYRRDGSEYWVDVNFVPIADDLGQYTHWVAVQREITQRKRAEDLERDRTDVLELVAKNQPLGTILTRLARMVERQCPQTSCSVFLFREGRFQPEVTPNGPAAHRPEGPLFVIDRLSPLALCPDPGVSAGIFQSAAPKAPVAGPHLPDLSSPLPNGCSVPILSGNGATLGMFAIQYIAPRRPTEEEVDLLTKASRLAAIAIEQRQLTDQLAHQAQHDALTGLPNRALLETRLEEALTQAKRLGSLVAVLFVDLDRFKQINDTLGHSVGDGLLRQVAQRLEGCLRKGDTLARMGGDEFTLLLTDLRNPQQALRVAQKLLDALKAPLFVEGYELFATASIGISLFPRDGRDAATLQRKADSAMYRAKTLGKNSYQVFLPEISATALESLELENALRKAVENSELQLHYQPQVNSAGRLMAFEALLVWNHPKLGLIAPSQFIPVAEESGLIAPIGDWVLRTACRQNAAWRAAGYPQLRVAVNVSAVQFGRSGFVDAIARLIAECGIDPSSLELELTESTVMHDVEESARQMQRLRGLGISLALDDFGTGYSSLSYLRRFPVDTLKIDQSFLRDLGTEPSTSPLVNAIVTLAHSLRLSVVAEGVETERQLEALRLAGCDRFQGYLFGPPVPVEVAGALLGQRDTLFAGLRRPPGKSAAEWDDQPPIAGRAASSTVH